MRLEIFADVLCPWCYIGKRRVAAALAGLEGVEVVWRAYELGPEASRTPGETAAQAMTGWWGAQAPARIEHIRAVGAGEGLELNLHLARPVNTFDAHRLTKLAAGQGRGEAVMEGLLRAYHTEGRNVADPAVLSGLAEQAGVVFPGSFVGGDSATSLGGTFFGGDSATSSGGAFFGGDAYAEEVRADRRRAVELGVRGVPSLVIDGRPPVSGVQPVPDLRALLTARDR